MLGALKPVVLALKVKRRGVYLPVQWPWLPAVKEPTKNLDNTPDL
jgi:hypothetical protein